MEKNKENNLDSYNKPFPKALRDLLDGISSPLKRKVNQKELADKAGISRQVISQYCNGNTSPNVETLRSIAEFFKVSSDYLIGITSIPATNIEDKAIHEKTGLSDTAIKKTKEIYNGVKESKHHETIRLKALNMILDNDFLLSLIGDYVIGDYEVDHKMIKGNYYSNGTTITDDNGKSTYMKPEDCKKEIIDVVDKNTGCETSIFTKDLSDMFLVKLQIELSKIREATQKERDHNGNRNTQEE